MIRLAKAPLAPRYEVGNVQGVRNEVAATGERERGGGGSDNDSGAGAASETANADGQLGHVAPRDIGATGVVSGELRLTFSFASRGSLHDFLKTLEIKERGLRRKDVHGSVGNTF